MFFLIISFSCANAQTIKPKELNSIKFEGNNSIPDHVLFNVLFSQETPSFLSKFFYKLSPSLGNPPIYFDSLLIEKDIKNLLIIYKSYGFFKTKIIPKIEKYDTYVDLIYFINERERSKYGKLRLIGFDKIDSKVQQEINKIQFIDTTTYYSANEIFEYQTKVIDELKDNGYYQAFFEKTKALVDTLKNLVNVTLILNPGIRYKLGNIKVEIKGSDYTYVQPKLVNEIINLKEGSWFNHTEIANAEARLYRTDLFSSSVIQLNNPDSIKQIIPIDVKTTLKLRNDISPELIANNEDNVFNFGFSIGYTRRNFFGGARKLNLQASATMQDPISILSNLTNLDSSFYGYSDVRLSLEQPFLFGKPVYTKLETYYTLQNKRNEYFSQIYGVRLLTDFILPRYVFLNGLSAFIRSENSTYFYKKNYVYNLFRNYILSNLPPEDQQEALDSLKEANLSNISSRGQNFYLGVDAVRNTTDDFRFPTKGYSLSLHLEDGNNLWALIKKIFSSNFERPQYIKAILTTVYYPKRLSTYTSVFGIKFKIGEIYLLNGKKSEIPLDERLYSGGSNSVRGWKNRELVPNNSQIEINSSNPKDLEAILLNNFTPGGFSLLEGSFEFRKKLVKTFGLAVFVDYGNTWLDFSDFRWNEVAVASGFGFRYYTDFFPIRFDFAFKVYDPYDRRPFTKKSIFTETFNFHLGIGEAF